MFIGSCKASNEDILNSINGISWVDAQKERMTIIQSHIDYLNTTIKSVKKIIEIVVKPYEGYINFLCTIPGIDRNSAISIIAEIGTDMSQFSSHLTLLTCQKLKHLIKIKLNTLKTISCSQLNNLYLLVLLKKNFYH